MTWRMLRVLSIALLALLGACSSDNVVSSAAPNRREIKFANMALSDPDVNAPGYFIPGVSPETCFKNYDASVEYDDADLDWLRDACEGALAAAFTPLMKFHTNEECPEWEPYWGAKVFLDGRVRIAYVPAYLKDCGYAGHPGDSELITIDLGFDVATQHWRVNSLWLSAHYKAPWYGHNYSESVRWDDIFYVNDQSRGRPIVWIGKNKHSNYKNHHSCDSGPDVCSTVYHYNRTFPVYSDRNVRGQWNGLGCVPHSGAMASYGTTECFYGVERKFRGWHEAPPTWTDTIGSTSYYAHLMDLFEALSTDNRDFGPGPDRPMPPPPPTSPSATIEGASDARTGSFCYWYLSVSNMPGALTYEWRLDGNLVGTNQDLWYVFNSAGTFTLEAAVSNGSSATGTSITVTASEWGGSCGP